MPARNGAAAALRYHRVPKFRTAELFGASFPAHRLCEKMGEAVLFNAVKVSGAKMFWKTKQFGRHFK
jgi:hypothetical protein